MLETWRARGAIASPAHRQRRGDLSPHFFLPSIFLPFLFSSSFVSFGYHRNSLFARLAWRGLSALIVTRGAHLPGALPQAGMERAFGPSSSAQRLFFRYLSPTSDACLLSPVPCLPERACGAAERGLMLKVEGCWAPANKAASSRRTPNAGAAAKLVAVRVPPLGGTVS